ncbi:uncharacterized protein LOC123551411 [Mercenaria mercenaria]|uniref:uncharacterized protein LOC123551411 n=1 Tax=Mercenaria mercenaria TaxID=6596 RepID=UPI00234EBAC1|nr:uncharacterized protein LOC123551411 [Mercenaria mercenaria]
MAQKLSSVISTSRPVDQMGKLPITESCTTTPCFSDLDSGCLTSKDTPRVLVIPRNQQQVFAEKQKVLKILKKTSGEGSVTKDVNTSLDVSENAILDISASSGSTCISSRHLKSSITDVNDRSDSDEMIITTDIVNTKPLLNLPNRVFQSPFIVSKTAICSSNEIDHTTGMKNAILNADKRELLNKSGSNIHTKSETYLNESLKRRHSYDEENNTIVSIKPSLGETMTSVLIHSTPKSSAVIGKAVHSNLQEPLQRSFQAVSNIGMVTKPSELHPPLVSRLQAPFYPSQSPLNHAQSTLHLVPSAPFQAATVTHETFNVPSVLVSATGLVPLKPTENTPVCSEKKVQTNIKGEDFTRKPVAASLSGQTLFDSVTSANVKSVAASARHTDSALGWKQRPALQLNLPKTPVCFKQNYLPPFKPHTTSVLNRSEPLLGTTSPSVANFLNHGFITYKNCRDGFRAIVVDTNGRYIIYPIVKLSEDGVAENIKCNSVTAATNVESAAPLMANIPPFSGPSTASVQKPLYDISSAALTSAPCVAKVIQETAILNSRAVSGTVSLNKNPPAPLASTSSTAKTVNGICAKSLLNSSDVLEDIFSEKNPSLASSVKSEIGKSSKEQTKYRTVKETTKNSSKLFDSDSSTYCVNDKDTVKTSHSYQEHMLSKDCNSEKFTSKTMIDLDQIIENEILCINGVGKKKESSDSTKERFPYFILSEGTSDCYRHVKGLKPEHVLENSPGLRNHVEQQLSTQSNQTICSNTTNRNKSAETANPLVCIPFSHDVESALQSRNENEEFNLDSEGAQKISPYPSPIFLVPNKHHRTFYSVIEDTENQDIQVPVGSNLQSQFLESERSVYFPDKCDSICTEDSVCVSSVKFNADSDRIDTNQGMDSMIKYSEENFTSNVQVETDQTNRDTAAILSTDLVKIEPLNDEVLTNDKKIYLYNTNSENGSTQDKIEICTSSVSFDSNVKLKAELQDKVPQILSDILKVELPNENILTYEINCDRSVTNLDKDSPPENCVTVDLAAHVQVKIEPQDKDTCPPMSLNGQFSDVTTSPDKFVTDVMIKAEQSNIEACSPVASDLVKIELVTDDIDKMVKETNSDICDHPFETDLFSKYADSNIGTESLRKNSQLLSVRQITKPHNVKGADYANSNTNKGNYLHISDQASNNSTSADVDAEFKIDNMAYNRKRKHDSGYITVYGGKESLVKKLKSGTCLLPENVFSVLTKNESSWQICKSIFYDHFSYNYKCMPHDQPVIKQVFKNCDHNYCIPCANFNDHTYANPYGMVRKLRTYRGHAANMPRNTYSQKVFAGYSLLPRSCRN